MREVPLTQSQVALVDDDDYERVSQRKWFACWQHRGYVAACKENYRLVYMHRFITRNFDAETIDHINGDGLDNRKVNLRPATRKENRRNGRKPMNGKHSKYKGVTIHRGTWIAAIQPDGQYIHLGTFSTETDAAKAYDKAAREYFGDFACTNF